MFRPMALRDLIDLEALDLETYLNALPPSAQYLECMRIYWAGEPWKEVPMDDLAWELVMDTYDSIAAREAAYEPAA